MADDSKSSETQEVAEASTKGVFLKNRSGRVVDVAPERAKALLADGFSQPTAEELKAAKAARSKK